MNWNEKWTKEDGPPELAALLWPELTDVPLAIIAATKKHNAQVREAWQKATDNEHDRCQRNTQTKNTMNKQDTNEKLAMDCARECVTIVPHRFDITSFDFLPIIRKAIDAAVDYATSPLREQINGLDYGLLEGIPKRTELDSNTMNKQDTNDKWIWTEQDVGIMERDGNALYIAARHNADIDDAVDEAKKLRDEEWENGPYATRGRLIDKLEGELADACEALDCRRAEIPAKARLLRQQITRLEQALGLAEHDKKQLRQQIAHDHAVTDAAEKEIAQLRQQLAEAKAGGWLSEAALDIAAENEQRVPELEQQLAEAQADKERLLEAVEAISELLHAAMDKARGKP